MKKSCLFGLLLLLASPLFAEHVDPETARKVAQTFLNNNGVKAAQLTDLSKEAGFPNLYIFNAERGFVVMAADDCVKPILGYSLTDKFIVEGMPENMRWWLQGYSDEIQWAIENNAPAGKNSLAEWQDLIDGQPAKDSPVVVVAPLLSTTWNQGSPYNMYCPSGTVTGCVATAMAQVMKFWNYPETGQGSHEYTHGTYGSLSADFGTTTYDWSNMINSYSGSFTNTQKEAVATLMFHCGVSVDMDYGPSSTGGSSASGNNVPPALIQYFKYAPSAQYKSQTAYTNEQWIAFLKTELDEERPLFYTGNNENNGHAFVCDGYRSDNYFHFNWGWGSYKDDYYAIGALNPNPTSGNAIGSGSGTYNLGNAVAAWVEPISDLQAPTLTHTINTNSIALSWNAINGASYDVYRDNVKIASGISENSFTDNSILSGTHYEYYVRSVIGAVRSNPSNFVTASAFYHDYTPTGLTAVPSSDDVVLNWSEPANNPSCLQYATGFSGTRYGMGENLDTYWAEVFDPSRLTNFAGMVVEKVSAYLQFEGNYTLYLFQDNPQEATNKLYEQTIPVSSAGWVDFELNDPVSFDNTKELWIIMFYPFTEGSSSRYWYPATSGVYDEIPYDDEQNNERYNPRLIGESLNQWYYIGGNISWLFRTYVSDGVLTYNLYDGESKVNGDAPINGTSYSISGPLGNGIHSYTVKTIHPNGESAASNCASLAVGSENLPSLELKTNNSMTVTSGSTLTVSGTLKNVNSANLIIEDGAQLIHHNDGVKATVRKGIEGYGDTDGGWYTIASPFSSFSPTDTPLTGDEFDLYAYDEDGQNEWVNYKAHTNTFNISPNAGYLYARHEGTSLTMTGTLINGDYNEVVPLSYGNDNDDIKGYNLLGNPTAHDITFTKTTNVADGYYYLSNSDNWVYQTGNTVPTGRGFLVKANASGQSVTLNPQSKEYSDDGQYLCIKIDEENAYVKMDEGISMPLLNFRENKSSLWLESDGQSYVMLVRNNANSIELNYKAQRPGLHILNIDSKELGLDYLHLIDRLTGTDIDLLQMPSYEFESTGSDYASRFQLVFSEDGNDHFHGGVFVDGKTQVIDLTGRVVATNRNTQLAPGVYLLRTANGNDIKTEKIIIK